MVIILLDGDGNEIDRTTTDTNGTYTFDDLPPGEYTVVVDTNTLPDDRSIVVDTGDGPAGVPADGQSTVTIGAGEDLVDVDFGIEPPAPIPLTGSDTLQLVLLALALCGAGAALLAGRRRFLASA